MLRERRSLSDRLLDVSLTVLIGVLTLYGAFWLLRAIWPELVVVALVAGIIVGLIGWWQGRRAGW